MDQKKNIMTDDPVTTVVVHIRKFMSYFKMEYGNKLNPEHSLRKAHGINGTKQKIIVTHKIDQNQLLLVRSPKLGNEDVIVP